VPETPKRPLKILRLSTRAWGVGKQRWNPCNLCRYRR